MGFLVYVQILTVFVVLGIFGKIEPKFVTGAFFVILLALLPFSGRVTLPAVKIDKCTLSVSLPVLMGIVAYVVSIAHVCLLPVLTTDGLLYHLPFALHYFKAGNLSLPPLFFSDIAMPYYPQGGEICSLFMLFARREYLLRFVQLPFAFFGAFSVRLILKRYGVTDRVSLVAACLFLVFVPTVRQAGAPFVDLIMSACFLGALYYFSFDDYKKIFLGILCCGMLLTTKTVALIYLILAVPVLISNVSIKTIRKGWRLLSAGVVFFLSVGLFSYWRNLFMTGNPFFPAQVSFGTKTLFPGLYVYSHSSFFPSLKHLALLFGFPKSAVDPPSLMISVLAVSLIVSLVLSIRRKTGLWYFFCIPLIGCFLYVLLVPQFYCQIRHLTPIYGILVMSAAYPFSKKGKAENLVYLMLPWFALSLFIMTKEIWPFLIVFSIIAGLFLLAYKFKRMVELFAVFVFLFLGFIFYWQMPLLRANYGQLKVGFWKVVYGKQGDIWQWVQENSEQGKTIAYVGEFLLYPLYGDGYPNDVYYQSVNSIETKPVYKYPQKEILFPAKFEELQGIYRRNPLLTLWYEGLRRHRTDWIVIQNGKGFIEESWIRENPSDFALLFSNSFGAIYKVNQPLAKTPHSSTYCTVLSLRGTFFVTRQSHLLPAIPAKERILKTHSTHARNLTNIPEFFKPIVRNQ